MRLDLQKQSKRGQIMDLLKFCSEPGDNQGKDMYSFHTGSVLTEKAQLDALLHL